MPSRPTIRVLGAGDEAQAARFLEARADTTMILRSNLARGGIVNAGRTYQGTYVGAFAREQLEGLAALYWNDNVILAGGSHVAALTEALADRASEAGRAIGGILGTAEEVDEARRVVSARLGAALRNQTREILYSLSLDELVLPRGLAALAARAPSGSEMDLLLEWRMQYSAEAMNVPDTPEQRHRQESFLRELAADGRLTLLLAGDAPVAMSAFNAALPGMVQVGGVFTPPALRGRGYARAVVAASLESARSSGVERAILFTQDNNVAAQRAYVALGFRPIGDYGIVVFE